MLSATALTLSMLTVLPVSTATAASGAVAEPAGAPVTLVGSLQDELGCDSDWNLACEVTDLQLDPASQMFTRQFAVPEGSWEFKVAVNRSWAESYGKDGGPDNIPLVLAGPATIEFGFDPESHRISIEPVDLPPATEEQDAALAGNSLRDDLTREQFYFVMADRFANSSTANDTGGLTGDRETTGFDPTAKGWYHGGDINGITGKLDYLKNMGITSIWMTPSFKNKPVQGSGDQMSAGYHGYWITDFTQIDPHLGTNDDLKNLIDKAHGKGMKVFFDIITNHTADVIATPGIYLNKTTNPYKTAAGEPFDDRDYVDGDPAFPELDPQTSFPYVPVLAPGDETVKVPGWLNDPTYYHNRGNAAFDGGESDVYGDFVGLDDLFTEQPVVRDGLIDIYKSWAQFGIDGFRIDTVKHVNIEFWQKFSPEIRAAAAAAGKDKFFMFGEVYDANPKNTSRFTTEGGLQATLDFGFQAQATGFAQGKPTTDLRDLFANDDYYTDSDSNVYSSPTFLGNHDMGRIGGFLTTDPAEPADVLLQRDELAHSLMYLTRGQPVVYYGDEQGFTGDGGDQDARQDMFPSQVGTYNDDDLIGTDATTAADNFDPTHPLYQYIAQLSKLRKNNPALADGAQIHRYASSSPGIYAFSRIDRQQRVEYIVAANNSTTELTATFDTFSPKARYRGLWPQGTDQLRSDQEGRVSVSVPPLSVKVWKATAPLKKAKSAPAINFKTPGPGGTVGGRAEVGVSVPAGGFNQVTLAWRPVGTTDWTPLGTDDNAPYRVFHDVTGLAKGTLLEYHAVLRDHSGNLNSASTYAVVGDPAIVPTDPGTGGPVEQPESVTIAGTLQDELGCPGEWQPDCAATHLTLDTDDQIWKATFESPVPLPAGSYQYKVAINDSWDENYGAGGVSNGGNITVEVPAGATSVTFYYDHRTHWVTTDVQNPIVTAPGDFQSELGCPGDWQPDCMLPWLQDPDGDGTYTYATTEIPAGQYQVKVAHGLSWAESYGAGGSPTGANIGFAVANDFDRVTFSYVLATHVLTVTSRAPGANPDLSLQKAQWLQRGLLAWDLPIDADNSAASSFRLHYAAEGGLAVDAEAVTGGSSIPLAYDAAGLPTDVKAAWPHLSGYDALRLPAKYANNKKLLKEILSGQIAVAEYDDLGRLIDATGVQIPGVLDDLYGGATKRRLGLWFVGATPVFSLWAPTAKNVTLLVDPPGSQGEQRITLGRDQDGIWTAWGKSRWLNGSYLYEVEVYVPATGKVEKNRVTDPYSVALTTNSTASVIADLSAASLTPAGWASLAKPALEQPDDSTIYELHIRDFSINDDSVPAANRGTYLAFTNRQSAGMQHLKRLADAGLNTVHLLPAFDIATIEENRAAQQQPDCDLPSLTDADPGGETQQSCTSAVADTDGYNWGYDPLHYTTPEGSYAKNPDGAQRTREFRRMVAGLNGIGLRVVMDVVYNHTAAAGQDDNSVLDKVVPGYYQRLSATGALETSTCCANTASEHAMMEKLMIDSLVTWAKQYKVDGFRFDLMGHHSKQNMLNIRAALDKLTLRRDGVDGKKIFLYGEGWNFGEVADNARFVQATQANMAGTGIATFSDRLRDAVRGGGPFDENPGIQGFGSGLFTDPNASGANGSDDEQRSRLLHYQDLIKVGLTGNLANYSFVNSAGEEVTGAQVDYNGSPAGYTAEPSEVISYVDAHDNETLFDALQFKLPATTPMADRVRMNTVSLATTALSQGPVLWHAGNDLLRSKSLDRNSFNSGDWFNRIDWTRQENTFGSGLPPATDNSAKWPFMQPLLRDPALKPTSPDMTAATTAAQELLQLRFSSPLFRLGSAALIEQKVSFPIGGADQTPGVIVMVIDDTAGPDVDPALSRIVVVFNASPGEQVVSVAGAGDLQLSPVQANSADPVVREAYSDAQDGTLTVPARTVAVFQG
ncbi:MAG: pullulanase-type alpha-1,6-glucosidase [Nakamurella sp.]